MNHRTCQATPSSLTKEQASRHFKDNSLVKNVVTLAIYYGETQRLKSIKSTMATQEGKEHVLLSRLSVAKPTITIASPPKTICLR